MKQPHSATNPSKLVAPSGLRHTFAAAREREYFWVAQHVIPNSQPVELNDEQISTIHGGHIGAILAAASALTSAINIEQAIAQYQVCCSLGVIDC
jgi:hypothetical protein